MFTCQVMPTKQCHYCILVYVSLWSMVTVMLTCGHLPNHITNLLTMTKQVNKLLKVTEWQWCTSQQAVCVCWCMLHAVETARPITRTETYHPETLVRHSVHMWHKFRNTCSTWARRQASVPVRPRWLLGLPHWSCLVCQQGSVEVRAVRHGTVPSASGMCKQCWNSLHFPDWMSRRLRPPTAKTNQSNKHRFMSIQQQTNTTCKYSPRKKDMFYSKHSTFNGMDTPTCKAQEWP